MVEHPDPTANSLTCATVWTTSSQGASMTLGSKAQQRNCGKKVHSHGNKMMESNNNPGSGKSVPPILASFHLG